jgi:hypothetical protein
MWKILIEYVKYRDICYPDLSVREIHWVVYAQCGPYISFFPRLTISYVIFNLLSL